MKVSPKSKLFQHLLGLNLSPEAFALLMYIRLEHKSSIHKSVFMSGKNGFLLLSTLLNIDVNDTEKAFNELTDKSVLVDYLEEYFYIDPTKFNF